VKFFCKQVEKGWGNGIYIDLEIMCLSKEDTAVPPILTLHTTSKTRETFPLILKQKH
jgi:hypothetical protein